MNIIKSDLRLIGFYMFQPKNCYPAFHLAFSSILFIGLLLVVSKSDIFNDQEKQVYHCYCLSEGTTNDSSKEWQLQHFFPRFEGDNTHLST